MTTSTLPTRMEPAYPGMLATPEEVCRHWQDLDAHFGTGPESPLHHDSRCELHNPA